MGRWSIWYRTRKCRWCQNRMLSFTNITYFVPYIISFETKVQYRLFTTTSITWKIQWWWLPCKILCAWWCLQSRPQTNFLLTKPPCQVGDMAIFSLHFFVHNIFIYIFCTQKGSCKIFTWSYNETYCRFIVLYYPWIYKKLRVPNI